MRIILIALPAVIVANHRHIIYISWHRICHDLIWFTVLWSSTHPKGPTWSPDSVKVYETKLLLLQDSDVPTMPLNISHFNTDTSMAAQMGTSILAACTTRAWVKITTVVCWCLHCVMLCTHSLGKLSIGTVWKFYFYPEVWCSQQMEYLYLYMLL